MIKRIKYKDGDMYSIASLKNKNYWSLPVCIYAKNAGDTYSKYEEVNKIVYPEDDWFVQLHFDNCVRYVPADAVIWFEKNEDAEN